MSEQKLIQEILSLSVSYDWNTARSEWELLNVTISETPETCLCDHYPIIELCTIVNKLNRHTAIVGNCCVKQFIGLPSDIIFQGIKRIQHNIEKAPNSALVSYANNHHWLSEWELQFLQSIGRKTKLSERQMACRIKINEKLLEKLNLKYTPAVTRKHTMKKIYIAGKIGTPHNFRPLDINCSDMDEYCEKTPVPISDFGYDFLYTGPFAIQQGHDGTGMDDESHGVDCYIDGAYGHTEDQETAKRGLVTQTCMEQIRSSDILLAWITSDDCYGTFAEIGFARGCGNIQIFIAYEKHINIDKFWFVNNMCINFACFPRSITHALELIKSYK